MRATFTTGQDVQVIRDGAFLRCRRLSCLDDMPVGAKVDVVVRPEDIIMTAPEAGNDYRCSTTPLFSKVCIMRLLCSPGIMKL